MQKLESEKINTPLNASQVQCNCGLQLNRVERLSVASKKTFYNNPEGNLTVLEVLGSLKPLKTSTLLNFIWRTAIPPTSKDVGFLAVN